MKKFEAKKINDMELGMVNGGTLGEMWDLVHALLSDNTATTILSQVADKAQNWSGIGKVTSPVNYLIRKEVKSLLKGIGVTADISIGFAGSGAGSDPNRYSYKGNRVSHNEVLNIIRNSQA